MSKKSADQDELPVVRLPLINGNGSYLVNPGSDAYAGTIVLVPTTPPPGSGYKSYYTVWAYISSQAGPTSVTLPKVDAIVLMDVPDGMFTSQDDIIAALKSGVGGGDPTGVGPSSPH